MARRTTVTKVEEVQDLESEEIAPRETDDMVTGLAFVTCLALVVGIVLAQLAMKKYFGTGLFA
jgi:hypothetical protein